MRSFVSPGMTPARSDAVARLPSTLKEFTATWCGGSTSSCKPRRSRPLAERTLMSVEEKPSAGRRCFGKLCIESRRRKRVS